MNTSVNIWVPQIFLNSRHKEDPATV